MANSNVYFTVPVPQPTFGFVRLKGRWHQVRTVLIHNEPDGVIKNTVTLPDGRSMVVDTRKIKCRQRRGNDIPHPEAAQFHL